MEKTSPTEDTPLVLQSNCNLSFAVEVRLSENQLRLMQECAGRSANDWTAFLHLVHKDGQEPIVLNPDLGLGLAADLNDILSLGFLIQAQLMKELELKTKIGLEDIWLHPYRHTIYDFSVKKTEVEATPLVLQSNCNFSFVLEVKLSENQLRFMQECDSISPEDWTDLLYLVHKKALDLL